MMKSEEYTAKLLDCLSACRHSMALALRETPLPEMEKDYEALEQELTAELLVLGGAVEKGTEQAPMDELLNELARECTISFRLTTDKADQCFDGKISGTIEGVSIGGTKRFAKIYADQLPATLIDLHEFEELLDAFGRARHLGGTWEQHAEELREKLLATLKGEEP